MQLKETENSRMKSNISDIADMVMIINYYFLINKGLSWCSSG